MLIRFAVSNFKSIRDEAELNLTAVNYYKEHSEELLDSKLPGLAGLKFLRSAAIYGPNASGKTAFFEALNTMRVIVQRSASFPPTSPLPYRPFLLDDSGDSKPTSFFAAFTAKNLRYEYSFSYTKDKITDEELSAFPKGHRQVWLSRHNGKLLDSRYLKIGAAIRPLLNSNMLVLSLLANYPNFEGAATVQPIVDWFSNKLTLVDRSPRSPNDLPFSGEILDGTTGTDYQREFIQNMLRKADVGISKAEVELHSYKERGFPDSLLNVLASTIGKTKEELDNETTKSVVFSHSTKTRTIKFETGDESEGTIRMFTISGHIAETLENGYTLVVDELDASLHPILVREIIRTFLSPESNPNCAQLIFTAHNPCLLEDDLLRRDQVWFTEKNVEGATTLYPLSEYKPRKDESMSTGYLSGRYSATPLVPECFGLCDNCSYKEA